MNSKRTLGARGDAAAPHAGEVRMRLYIKLVALILLTLAANQYAVSSARRQAAWFTIRCAYAEAARNERMQERLVAEGQAYLIAHGQWEGDENAPLYVARASLAAG